MLAFVKNVYVPSGTLLESLGLMLMEDNPLAQSAISRGSSSAFLQVGHYNLHLNSTPLRRLELHFGDTGSYLVDNVFKFSEYRSVRYC